MNGIGSENLLAHQANYLKLMQFLLDIFNILRYNNRMKFNRFRGLSTDPFISHMRISYEDGIRNQTEEYWRKQIANEIRSYKIEACNNVDILYAQERLRSSIVNLVEGEK